MGGGRPAPFQPIRLARAPARAAELAPDAFRRQDRALGILLFRRVHDRAASGAEIGLFVPHTVDDLTDIRNFGAAQPVNVGCAGSSLLGRDDKGQAWRSKGQTKNDEQRQSHGMAPAKVLCLRSKESHVGRQV
jgi:hypothetical protein